MKTNVTRSVFAKCWKYLSKLHWFLYYISVPHRVVPLCLCGAQTEAQRKMVLSKVSRGTQEKIAKCLCWICFIVFCVHANHIFLSWILFSTWMYWCLFLNKFTGNMQHCAISHNYCLASIFDKQSVISSQPVGRITFIVITL